MAAGSLSAFTTLKASAEGVADPVGKQGRTQEVDSYAESGSDGYRKNHEDRAQRAENKGGRGRANASKWACVRCLFFIGNDQISGLWDPLSRSRKSSILVVLVL